MRVAFVVIEFPILSQIFVLNQITGLIEHPEVWLEMGKADSAYVEKSHDIDKLNDRRVEMYQQLLVK